MPLHYSSRIISFFAIYSYCHVTTLMLSLFHIMLCSTVHPSGLPRPTNVVTIVCLISVFCMHATIPFFCLYTLIKLGPSPRRSRGVANECRDFFTVLASSNLLFTMYSLLNFSGLIEAHILVIFPKQRYNVSPCTY